MRMTKMKMKRTRMGTMTKRNEVGGCGCWRLRVKREEMGRVCGGGRGAGGRGQGQGQ